MKKKWTLIILVTILVVVGASFNSLSSTQSTNPVQAVDKVETIQKADVVMPTKVSRPGCEQIDSCYTPSKIVITPGNSVTWLNEDAAFHSVTSGSYDEPKNLFDSGYLDPEEFFTISFETPGIYDYFCTLHPWMKGQVIVESF